MAAENFKVKKGLEVGTAITATSSGVNVTGIVTATQFVGDGSGLTGVTGSGSGVVVKDEGSAVGTAGTINFVGSGVAASLSLGTATITVNAGGLDNVVEDTTPQLGGNLDLNGKFVNGTGGANITGVVTATTLKGNGDFVDIDVDGRADLDDLVVAGVSTFGNNINASGTSRFEIASMENGVLDGEISHNGDATTKIKFPSNKNISFDTDGTTRLNINNSGAIITGISTFSSNIDANGNLDVDGRTDLDDLVVSGVGTFSTRIDTNGVSFGTNNNTFAAKFADDAVANFGTDNDLKIYHNDTNGYFLNSKGQTRFENTDGNIGIYASDTNGDIIMRVGGDQSTENAIVAVHNGEVVLSFNGGTRITTTNAGATVAGTLSATTFSGSGASLTNLPSAQLTGALPALDGSALTGVTASGTGIIVKHDGSTVGTAGTINFSTNLDVSAISAGIVTVTASGGSSQNLFSTIAVSGQSNVVADSTTDTLTFAAGSNVTLTTNAGTDTVTIAAANDNTQLSSEQVQDIVGAMFSSNTETDITATYQDADGTIDLVVDLSSLNAGNLDSGTIPNGRFPATLPVVSGVNLTALNASEITSGTLPIARIADDAVTFAKMQNVGTGVFIGRNDGGTGDIETLTAAEARTLLNVADGANVGVTTAAWTVGHSGSSNYVISGPGGLSNANNPDLYLERGQTYQFIVNASGHGFGIQTSSGTWNSSNAYTTGITNAGAAVGTITFEVRHDAPSRLYYACTSQHGGMVGNIYIIGNLLENGADNRVLTATSSYGMNGEANLTFDGTRLGIGGAPSGIALDISRNTQGGIRITDTAVTNASYEIRPQTGNSTKLFRIIDVSAGDDVLSITSAGQVQVNATTNTSSTSSGALKVSGGVGIAKDVYIGGGDIVFTATSTEIKTNSSDGSDNKRIILCGGGDNSQVRGAQMTLYGNEYSSHEGRLQLLAGNSGNTNGVIQMYTGGDERLLITSGGRVNIGQASDVDHTLCVAGTDNTTSLTGGHSQGIQLQNKSTTDGTYSQIEWRTSSGGRYARIAGIQDDANGNGGQLVFLTETSGGTTTEKLRITSTGIIDAPDQAGFYVRMQGNKDNVMGGGASYYTVLFDTDSGSICYNPGTAYATGTGLYTVPIGGGGYYMFSTAVCLSTDAYGRGGEAWFLVGSNRYFFDRKYFTNTTGTITGYYGTSILKLTAGQTVGVQAFVSGGSTDVDVLGASSANHITWFTGRKIP